MPSWKVSTGQPLTLWTRDRTDPTAAPLVELRDSLASIGIPCDIRSEPRMAEFEFSLSPSESKPYVSHPSRPALGPEGFLLGWREKGLFVRAETLVGVRFATWEVLERWGWVWATPEITQAPTQAEWVFPAGNEVHRPAMPVRIFFAEEVEVTPRLVWWLARHRFNAFFPANPTRFSAPEEQVTDAAIQQAVDLQLEIVAGGDFLPWLAEIQSGISLGTWKDITPRRVETFAEAAIALWEELGTPAPRLSVWPDPEGSSGVSAFLKAVAQRSPEMRFETHFSVQAPSRLLNPCWYRVEESAFDLNIPVRPGDASAGRETGRLADFTYVALRPLDSDSRLANSLTPVLWRASCGLILQAMHAGYAGAAWTLERVPSRAFMERAAFSIAAVGRTLWAGESVDMEAYVRRHLRAQYESGAGFVETTLNDLERWVNAVTPGTRLSSAHDVLKNENMRDKLDQRISELEECPPSEACMELARSLSTLVGLYDLEECGDRHECKALARTLWRKNSIDEWPDWLRKASPLAERLLSLGAGAT